MSMKLQMMCGVAFFLGMVGYTFLSKRNPKKSESADIVPFEKPESNDDDVAAKKKIMSEIGKKGAAKSAEVRRAKKAKKEAAADNVDS